MSELLIIKNRINIIYSKIYKKLFSCSYILEWCVPDLLPINIFENENILKVGKFF